MPNIFIKMCGVSCVLKINLVVVRYYSRHVAIMMVLWYKTYITTNMTVLATGIMKHVNKKIAQVDMGLAMLEAAI